MHDLNALKAGLDCRALIARDLGEPRYFDARYALYKCPLHRETKGYSLVVYADGWRCYGRCGRHGDAIAWVMAYHGLRFTEACQRLWAADLPSRPAPAHEPARQPFNEPPDERWGRAARRVMNRAMDTLWSQAGKRAWDYLQTARGLNERTIVGERLGYIPGRPDAWQTLEGLTVPCGITIPWVADGALWGIKVRRAAGEQRYQQVSGGNLRGGLYRADAIQPGRPLLIVEGEFDALAAAQVAGDLVSAVALGSASHSVIPARWLPRLLAAPRLLICTDSDAAGEAASLNLARLSASAIRVRPPDGLDLNATLTTRGPDALRAWLVAATLEL